MTTIKSSLIVFLCLLCSAQSDDSAVFENTQPIVKGSKLWNVTIDSSRLQPHFIVSKIVTNSTHDRAYFNLKTIKDFKEEEIGSITGIWLMVYDENENLMGTVDHLDASLKKSAKLFTIPENLKRGAIFQVEIKAPYEFTRNTNIDLIRVVFSKVKPKK